MTAVQIESGALLASLEDRTVSGLLVPYGEVGNTNLGKFSIPAGTAAVPLDPSIVGMNTDHNRENPVARAVSLTDTPEGVRAVFAMATTPQGDAALAEAHSPTGKRNRLSVEMTDIVIRAGKLVSGRIFGAALVAKGAFPSAALFAADVGTDPAPAPAAASTTVEKTTGEFTDEAGVTHTTTVTKTTTVDGDKTTISEITVIDEPAPEGEPTVGAPIPKILEAKAPATTAPRGLSLTEMGVLYAQRSEGRITDADFATAIEGQNGNALFAALSDVKFDGTGGLSQVLSPAAQWLGQAWQATNYRQQVLPLFNHAILTSLSFTGWKWGTKPAGGNWPGNKGDVLSNTLTVTATPGTASRYAIGHDIAREFVDFPVEGFFEGYAAGVSEDYARWADGKVATAIIAGATTLAADALTTLPGVSGGTIGSAASAIIDGASVIITAGSLPDFALVAPALWKQMVKMPKSNVMGYLNAALGLQEGTLDQFIIRPSSSIAAGRVLVGCKAAATVLELGGESPVRIDALDLARGGIDKAAFGYLGVSINDAVGLQYVTAATA